MKVQHTMPIETVVDIFSNRMQNTQNNVNHSNHVKIPISNAQTFLNFGYLNARSICNKAEEIHEFIEERNLDISAVTETWLSSCSESNRIVCGDLTPDGFSLLYTPRAEEQGGGVAVVLRSSVKATKEERNFHSFELMELLCKFADVQLRLIVLYCPPSHSVTDFIDVFFTYMDSLINSTGRLLVVGDFNIHVDSELDPGGEKLSFLLYSLHLEQHVKLPTHIHGHTLDLLISRCEDDLITGSVILPPALSDHHPIMSTLSINTVTNSKKIVQYRRTKDTNIDSFIQDIRESELCTNPANGVNTLVEQYNSTLTKILDKHAPGVSKSVPIKLPSPCFNAENKSTKTTRRKME